MDLKSDFLREFQPTLDGVRLPEALGSTYRLESCLSQDAQGSAWLIRRREDGARLVLRVSGAGELREEFEIMERLPADLAGRVPRAVDFCEADGIQYLVRTYLPGRSLAEVWGDRSEEQCAALGTSLCALLERLHRLSPPIIHRDIKPENIILSPGGTPGLIDFGIARAYDPERDTDTVHMGTRATAAPEQYGFTQSDQRTDLYALGVTLRWMVTGSYRPEALETAECSVGMKRFLRKAAAFDPADRFSSAAAMGKALTALSPAKQRSKRIMLASCLCLLVLPGLMWRQALEEQAITFDSPLLEEAVRAELNMPSGEITRRDLKQVRRLAVVGQEVLKEGQDYQYRLCAYIDGQHALDAPPGDLSDLSLLLEMPNLTTLYLCNQQISDLSPLKGLPLRELYLCDNQIYDLAPLRELPDIEVLYIAGNPWTDLAPLSGLKNLRRLNLDSWDFGKNVDSLAPLVELELEFLSIGNLAPAASDWSALGQIENLDTLWLWDPSDEAVAALAACQSLRSLHLGNYRKPDLTELPVIPHLAELSTYSRLPSLEGVQKQKGLTRLNLCNQPDMDLTPVAALDKLLYFSVSECPISDFSPLADLPGLREAQIWEENLPAMEASCPVRTFTISIS